MVDIEVYKAREARYRSLAHKASNADVRWMYEDMARHYANLIEWGAYDADARAAPDVRRDP